MELQSNSSYLPRRTQFLDYPRSGTTEQTESVSDVLCDVCGDSSRVEGYGLQFGTLRAICGYGSAHDGERYEVHLCEPCFFRTLFGLRRERMVNFMFTDENQDLNDFGRDDFFNDSGSSAT